MKAHGIAFLCAVLVSSTARAAPVDDAVAELSHHWAQITYQTPAGDRAAAYKTLADAAAQVEQRYPNHAGPLIWEAIVLGSWAKADGGLSALGKVKKARDLLLAAEKIDPNALGGSVYTSLGSLYAKVPGWPIAYGDKDKARSYLETALRINPTGIDAHYFYADLLADRGDYAGAVRHLEAALAAPPRPGREDADAGRRQEAQTLLDAIRRQHADKLAAN